MFTDHHVTNSKEAFEWTAAHEFHVAISASGGVKIGTRVCFIGEVMK